MRGKLILLSQRVTARICCSKYRASCRSRHSQSLLGFAPRLSCLELIAYCAGHGATELELLLPGAMVQGVHDSADRQTSALQHDVPGSPTRILWTVGACFLCCTAEWQSAAIEHAVILSVDERILLHQQPELAHCLLVRPLVSSYAHVCIVLQRHCHTADAVPSEFGPLVFAGHAGVLHAIERDWYVVYLSFLDLDLIACSGQERT